MTKAPLVLGFDTSGPWCGCVLLSGPMVLDDFHQDMARGHAEQLFPALEELLRNCGANWQDLDAIAVGVGPGNFTGIRISVSAARGLALALDVPAIGVSLLDALAYGRTEPVLGCLSAPRDHVYVQGFRMQASVPRQLLPLTDVPQEWNEPGLAAIGTAGETVAEHLGALHQPAIYAPASAIARIAAERWQTPTEPPAPLYIKPADAAPSRDVPPVILDDER
jgi:tRNA threonylcarbamoyladenosine biosynthesis protein TsaB